MDRREFLKSAAALPAVAVPGAADAAAQQSAVPEASTVGRPYTSKVLSEQDLRDIHAYLRSIPPSPAASTIDLLKR
jgi:hypothetical protein